MVSVVGQTRCATGRATTQNWMRVDPPTACRCSTTICARVGGDDEEEDAYADEDAASDENGVGRVADVLGRGVRPANRRSKPVSEDGADDAQQNDNEANGD